MKVSVIIPCYNLEEHIAACIKALANQELKDFEVIIVDDGSTDNSASIINNSLKTFNLESKLISQENKGACAARNKGLEIAKGEFIQFLDGDDILGPAKLLHHYELAKQKKADYIIGSYEKRTIQGEVLYEKIIDPTKDESPWNLLMQGNLGITSSNFFDANLFKNGIRWKEELKSSQEYALMFEIMKKSTNMFIDHSILTQITVRDQGSISKSNISEKWNRYVQLRIEIFEYLKQGKHNVELASIEQSVFESIRMYYPFSKAKAIGYFKKYIDPRFIPKQSPMCGKIYVGLYRLLGFERTEKFRSLFRRKRADA
ncbi:MAG: glycosyltransferase family 2 protein [Bacteroidota bacterium]